MTQVWMEWCRLCAREDRNSNNSHINVLLKNEDELQLSDTIYDFFSIKIQNNRNIHMICTDCYNLIRAIINLKQRLPRVNAMFVDLLATTEDNIDLDMIKVRHNLECDFKTLIISSFGFEAENNKSEEAIDEEETLYKNISLNPIESDLEEEEERNTSYHLSFHNDETSSTESKTFIPKRKKKYKSKREKWTEEKTKPHFCSKCSKGFIKFYNYKRHMQSEHGITVENKQTLYVCVKCGKKCVSLSSLKEHQFSHAEERTFKCRHCEKMFKSSLSLKFHLDTHNETSYICVVCGLQLNTRQTLRNHMVVHSDQKKYKCEYCGNEYKRDKALKVHLILHTGLKPFKCDFCDKAYADISNCNSHKKKYHSAEFLMQQSSGKNKAMQP